MIGIPFGKENHRNMAQKNVKSRTQKISKGISGASVHPLGAGAGMQSGQGNGGGGQRETLKENERESSSKLENTGETKPESTDSIKQHKLR